MHFLLIDDAAEDNFLHGRTLRKQYPDCTVATAADGREGLAYLRSEGREAVDTIFLDVNMPNMDGWAFLEAYMQLPVEQRARQIFLMLSGRLPAADEARLEAYGTAVRSMDKPLAREILSECVKPL